jgi:hypothetical protein
MSNLENNFSIYPYGYEDELAKKRAANELLLAQEEDQRAFLAETIAKPADATARGIGDLAIQSFTGGILQPSFDTETRTRELPPVLDRQIGRPIVRQLVSMDRSPMLVSENNLQSAVNQQALVGYAQPSAA